MTYKHRREWSDLYLQKVKRILSPIYGVNHWEIETSKDEEDWHLCADLIIRAQSKYIGVRLRKNDYWEKYPHDITIRTHGYVKAESELHKILEGHGDVQFYGFIDNQDNIVGWKLVCMHKFRTYWAQGKIEHVQPTMSS